MYLDNILNSLDYQINRVGQVCYLKWTGTKKKKYMAALKLIPCFELAASFSFQLATHYPKGNKK